MVEEKVREDDLRGLGLEVVRWGTIEMRNSPEHVAQRVKAARSRGDISRLRGRLRVDGQWLTPTEHRSGWEGAQTWRRVVTTRKRFATKAASTYAALAAGLAPVPW